MLKEARPLGRGLKLLDINMMDLEGKKSFSVFIYSRVLGIRPNVVADFLGMERKEVYSAVVCVRRHLRQEFAEMYKST
jgi:hypothetical protein